jgi:hypothetical protein
MYSMDNAADKLVTGKFTIHTHLALHDTAVLCTPDGRPAKTLSGPSTKHLYQLFRPDPTHRKFEEEVFRVLGFRVFMVLGFRV